MQQRTLVWQSGKLSSSLSTEALQDALRDPKAVVWLDLQIGDNRAEYTDLLSQVFKLAPIVTQTIGDTKERAKLLESRGCFYLVVHGLVFDAASGEADTPKLDIVFGKNFLVTAHRNPLPWLDTLFQSLLADESEDNLMSRGTPVLLYSVMDALVDSYFPVLDTIDDLVDDLEDATVNATSDAVQGRIFRTKRALAQMRRVISPQVEIANSLIARTGDLIPTEVEPYFSDVHDHLVRTFEVLDSYRDLMSGLLDVYLSTISNRLNQVMKQLTIIATIFMPITFITGVFGQNFAHSPQVEHDSGYTFWIVLGFMVLITAVQIAYFRMRKWI